MCFDSLLSALYDRPSFDYSHVIILLSRVQFLRKMAQPYDKAGSGGKKTLLSQDDLEKMGDEMLY